MESNEVKSAAMLAGMVHDKDSPAKTAAIAKILKLCDSASSVEEKLLIVQQLFPWLDESANDILRIVSSLPIPAVNSAEEVRLQDGLRRMLRRLWETSGQFSAQACDITRACIKCFQSRILGADTFEFGDFVHTSLFLGKGTEGVVHLGFQISQNGRRVAIKTISRSKIDQNGWETPLNKGFAFLQKANHPSIVKLYHVQKLETCWYVYMEHIDGGDLRSFLCKQDASKKEPLVRDMLSEAKAKEIFRKLVEPVGYLRRSYVIHRDLKPANFMLTRSGEVKLVDFATMRDSVESGGLAESIKGTPSYMAPEIWESSKMKYDGEKVDVWSMGVILYEMVCGTLPWEANNIQTLYRNITSTALRIPPSLGLSKELCDLLLHTLKVDPRFRMTWHELEGHEWLADDPMAGVGNFMEEAVNQLQLTVEKLQLKCRTMEQAAENKDNVIRELSRELQQHRQEAAQHEEERVRSERKSEEAKMANLVARKEKEAAEREALWQKDVADREAVWQKDLAEREARWQKEVADRDRAMASLQASVQVFEGRLAQAAEHAASLKKENETASAELRSGLKREEDLKEKVLLATRQVVSLREAAGNMQRLQEEVVQLRQSQGAMFAMQERAVAAEQEAAAIRNQHNALVSERDHLKSMVDDVLGNLTKSADGHQDVREYIRRLEENLEERELLLRQRDAEIESLRAEIATLKFLVDESNNMH